MSKNGVTKIKEIKPTRLMKSYNPAGGTESKSSWTYRPPEENLLGEDEGIRLLARAKIAQHVRDLVGINSGGDSKQYIHGLAVNWFFDHSDAEFWFDLAGYDWGMTIVRIKKFYLESRDGLSDITKRMKIKWRAASGQGKRYDERKAYRTKLKAIRS